MFFRLFTFSFLVVGILSLPSSMTGQSKVDPKKKESMRRRNGIWKSLSGKWPAGGLTNSSSSFPRRCTELNPLFKDFTLQKIENNEVARIGFDTTYVDDVSPIRAFAKLRELQAAGATYYSGKLADISASPV